MDDSSTDKPTDFESFDALGRQADRITDTLRDRRANADVVRPQDNPQLQLFAAVETMKMLRGPVATRREFKGYFGGKPTKPKATARVKPRNHRSRE